MDLDNYSVTCGITNLQFNPDRHPHATLIKAFNEFIKQCKFCYIAQYPVRPKNAIDSEIKKWQSQNRNKELTTDIKAICHEWISKDKVRKLLGFFATVRLQQDWKAAEILLYSHFNKIIREPGTSFQSPACSQKHVRNVCDMAH